MFRMLDLTDLWNHIGYMILCLPDHFPIEDFLSDEDQMDMDKGYTQLHEGISVAYPKEKHSGQAYNDLRSRLATYLHQSQQAYNEGDVVKGAHLLQDFQDEIFIKKGKIRLAK